MLIYSFMIATVVLHGCILCDKYHRVPARRGWYSWVELRLKNDGEFSKILECWRQKMTKHFLVPVSFAISAVFITVAFKVHSVQGILQWPMKWPWERRGRSNNSMV